MPVDVTLPAVPYRPPLPQDVWQAWNWDPLLMAGLVLAGALYASGVLRVWRQAGAGRAVSYVQVAAFACVLLSLAAALVSPLDAMSSALLSVHMVQHLMLMLVAAPLLAFGTPPVAFAWILPRRSQLARWWRTRARLRQAWHGFSQPAVIWIMYNAILWLWHLPNLYQAALLDEGVHIVEHLTFLTVALLFWWKLMRDRSLSTGMGALYVFTTALVSGFLGVLLTFSQRVWYPVYGVVAYGWGLTPLQDQQLAGVIMWFPGGLIYLAATLLLLGTVLHPRGRPGPLGAEGSRRVVVAPRRSLPLLLFLLLGSACQDEAGAAEAVDRPFMPGGDAERGAEFIEVYGCPACHTIPGIPEAQALVGPPLTGWVERVYIAGAVPNTPDNLLLWLQDPQQIEPGTAMPDMGITEQVARDIGAYLYTLESEDGD